MARALVSLLALAGLAVASPALAQLRLEDPGPTATTLPPTAGCYSLFLSPRQARETYLLDACTGETWLRVSVEDRSGWQKIPREANDDNTETLSHTRHYQLVSSGLSARDTFLVNALNGASWQLFEAADGTIFWGAMVREK